MKNTIYIVLFLLIGYTAYSQSLSLFNIDASNFPIMKANFYGFDAAGKQIANLNPSDFEVKENGQPRTVSIVSCPSPKPPQKVSIAMSIDVSGSMAYSDVGESPVELGKTTARVLCNSVPMPPSEFALQTCDSKALIVQDFTTERAKLLSKIDPIIAQGDNDFVEHLLNHLTGLLNITKKGHYKKVAVLFTDAWWCALTDDELQACKDTCSKYNIQFYAVIYSSSEAEPNGIKKSLQLLANATGGYLYDGITTTIAAVDIANCLQLQAQGGDPCQIEWQSGIICKTGLINVEVMISQLNLVSNLSYQSPDNSVAKLELSPTSVKFKNAIPGINKDTTITVTVRNADFNVTNITSSNLAYSVTPTSFFLNSGKSKDLTISYLPTDSGYTYTKFTFENDKCPIYYYASGGFPWKKPKIQTLKLIQPNGGEFLAVGNDTIITWEGVLPEDNVKIEYSTDNGVNWILIAKNATGLAYNWRIPNTPSNQCLARVTAITEYDCADVLIGNQIWMGCNLYVDHYRNGDSIPEVRDSTQWANLTTGAWCYYNNDPKNGEIYGKLYNWYAVSDLRGLAPTGWYIPSDEDWSELEICIGGKNIAGGKLKSIGTIEAGDGLWFSPNKDATNEIGFSAVPAGYRYHLSDYQKIGIDTYFWTSTESGTKSAYYRHLGSEDGVIGRSTHYFENGFSIRCLRIK